MLSATTFTLTVDDTPLVASIVIVALPVPTAFTTPFLFTVATLLLSLENSISSELSDGRTEYDNFKLSPRFIVTSCCAITMLVIGVGSTTLTKHLALLLLPSVVVAVTYASPSAMPQIFPELFT